MPLLGGLGPHLTQCRLERSIPPYQVVAYTDASSRLATTDMGRKLGGGWSIPLLRELGPI